MRPEYRYFCHADGFGGDRLSVLRIRCEDEHADLIAEDGTISSSDLTCYLLSDAERWVAEGDWIEGDINGPFTFRDVVDGISRSCQVSTSDRGDACESIFQHCLNYRPMKASGASTSVRSSAAHSMKRSRNNGVWSWRGGLRN